jgi:O-antigen ligase
MRLLKYLNIAIEICLLLAIGLSPVFFQCLTYRCWETNQLFLIQILIELATFFWLLKVTIGWQPPKLSLKLVIPVFLFLVILTLATIFSQAPQLSFLGSYARKMGLITWIHYFLFFLVFVSEIKRPAQIKRILATILISTSLVCLYGILQILGLDVINWGVNSATVSYRIFSSLGQPTFLGQWLLLVVPLVLYSFYCFKSFLPRIFISLLTVIIFLSLLLTLSRAAWLGLVAEAFCFFLLWIFSQGNKKKIIIWLLLITIIMSSWLWAASLPWNPQKALEPPILDRLVSFIFLQRAVTGHTRLLAWHAAIDLIRQKPFLGYGPEIFGLHTIKYYQPTNAIYEAINSYPDRAHNDILDTLLIAGFLGLAAYLYLLISFFWQAGRFIKNKFKDGPGSYALMGAILLGLIGYLVALQFGFHVIQTAFYFWLYLALIYVITINLGKSSDDNFSLQKIKIDLKKIIIFVLLLLITFVFIWQFSVKMIVADWYYKRAIVSVRSQNITQGIDYYKQAMSWQPEESYYRESFARDLLDLTYSVPDKNKNDKIKLFDLAIQIINDIPSGQISFEAQAYRARLRALKAWDTQRPEDFQVAEQDVSRLVSFSPKMAVLYYDWCRLKFYEKKLDAAVDKCSTALSLYPDLTTPQLGPTQRLEIENEVGLVKEQLAELYITQHKYDKTLILYQDILKLNPQKYSIYKKIADIYYLRHDLDSAIKYNLHGMVLSPNDFNWPWGLALLYYEKGNAEMAIKYADMALKLKPDSQLINTFLQRLKK